jgi:repressor LexA
VNQPMIIVDDERDPLTIVQWETLQFVQGYVEENRFAPSVRDIQDGLDLSSTSVVHHRLGILERKGYIERERFQARSIRLVDVDLIRSAASN